LRARLWKTAAMLRSIVLALTVCTGFTGLAYEITWQKYLAILLGAHSEATATVLGLFLGGLSLGYWLFGAVTRRLVERGRNSGKPAPLLLVYGVIEAGIGLYCLIFPWIFPVVRSASVGLPTGEGALAFAVDTGLAALLIVPPATLMGGTIPILTQALARDLEDATRVHALIYGWNTVGAFLGSLATGFFLIEWLGLDGVLWVLGWVNVVAGGVFALMSLRQREIVPLEPTEAAPLRTNVFAVYGTAALLVGFAMMVLQTVTIRIAGLSFGSSEYTFAMVVAVFVLCIARGSFGVSSRAVIGRYALVITLWVLALYFAGLYFLLETSPYWAHVLRVVFRDFSASFYPYYLATFAVVLIVIGPAVVLSGATLPLLFHALRREVGDLGAQAGRLYSANTVGSLLGALVGGYLLLIWLDLHHTYRIAVAAIALAATIVTLHLVPRIRFVGAAALLLVAFVGLGEFPAWRVNYLMAGTFRSRQPEVWTFAGPSVLGERRADFSFHDDDPNTSVGILDSNGPEGLTRSILVNGKSDGNSSGDLTTTVLLGLVPAMFADPPSNAFVIGFGTGVTAGTLAELPEVQKVTIAEISSAVIKAAPLFDFADHGVSTHPKVQIVHSDAYRALLKGNHSYDVIVSEPSNPWVTGIEQLYSREFLSEARDRLTPRGVYCQWFHRYEVSDEAIALVLKTFASVFDHVSVWQTNRADLMLLGFRDGELATDVDRLARRAERPEFRAEMERLGISGLPALLAHETIPLGVVRAAALRGPIHSLYHPRLNFEAGRAFFVGNQGTLPFTGYGEPAQVGSVNSLAHRYFENRDGADPEPIRAALATRSCYQRLPGCGAYAASWSQMQPKSEEFRTFAATIQSRNGPLFMPRMRVLLGTPPANPKQRIRPAVAVDLTRLFMEEYAHGAPLEPSALLGFWERCGLSPAGESACQRGVRTAQRMMIGDAPPQPDHWLTAEIETSSLHAAPADEHEEGAGGHGPEE
jgi:spermidine synthase